MTQFEIWLSWEDTERLFYSKQRAGKDDLTGNEYAKELLQIALHKLCPKVPETDDNGDYII